MFIQFLKFIWPYSNVYSDPDLTKELEKIKTAHWENKPEVFLEEARRLRDIETARKNIADTKSQIYLGVLLAIVPIAITVGSLDFFTSIFKSLNPTSIFASVTLMLGLIYGVGAFVYALKTLSVAIYFRVDVDELVKHSSSSLPIDEIIREILISVRNDRIPVNQKITLVKVTQGHITRMAFMFAFGLSILTIFPHLFEGLDFIWKTVCN